MEDVFAGVGSEAQAHDALHKTIPIENNNNEVPVNPENKENELFERAIVEVDGVVDGGKRINLANRQYVEKSGLALNGVSRVATNGSPREVGYREIQQVHDQVRGGVRSTLDQLSETLEKSVVNPNTRSQIETLIKQAISTQDPLDAQRIANQAIDSFGKMVGVVAQTTVGLQEGRGRVKGRTDQNEDDSRRLAQRLSSELTYNYARASRNLSQVVYESEPSVRNLERQENVDNQGRFERFKNALSDITSSKIGISADIPIESNP